MGKRTVIIKINYIGDEIESAVFPKGLRLEGFLSVVRMISHHLMKMAEVEDRGTMMAAITQAILNGYMEVLREREADDDNQSES